MKVLHVLAQLPMRTGSGFYFTNLIDGLEEQGEEIENTIIYGVQAPFDFSFKQKSFPVKFKSQDLPFPIVGMSDEMPYENTVYSEMTDAQVQVWLAAFAKRLVQAKKEINPDIIISHHLWYLTDLVLDTFPDTPVIGISHGTDVRQALKHPHLKTQYISDMNRLALVFALSHKDKEQVEAIFGVDKDKIMITQAGFNQKLFNGQDLSSEENRIHIVYAGKIAHAKGVYELAQVFPELKEKHPEIVFHLVGSVDDDNRKILNNLAGNSEDFIIYDVKNQEKLALCMKQCDIFVLPSYYEGMGLIAIEALACKLRVVVTEIEGLMELLGDDVNQSNVISYVKLPRLINQDQPVEADLPDYIDRLREALDEQVNNVKSGKEFPEEIYQDIYRHSWSEVIQQQLEEIRNIYNSIHS